jgi:hypothetical protein
MSMEREPYVRPFVMRLDYSTDNRVSMAQVCKQEADVNGPTPNNCLDVSGGIPVPCVEVQS